DHRGRRQVRHRADLVGLGRPECARRDALGDVGGRDRTRRSRCTGRLPHQRRQLHRCHERRRGGVVQPRAAAAGRRLVVELHRDLRRQLGLPVVVELRRPVAPLALMAPDDVPSPDDRTTIVPEANATIVPGANATVVPGASSTPSAPSPSADAGAATTSTVAWPTPPPAGRDRRRIAVLVAIAAVVVVIVGVVVALTRSDSTAKPAAPPLAVTGVLVGVQTQTSNGGACQTAVLDGAVTTNGGTGTLTYRWERADGTVAGAADLQLHVDRQTPVHITFTDTVHGGTASFTTRLHLLNPTDVVAAPVTYTVTCP